MLKIKKKITTLVILFAMFLLTIGFAIFGLNSTTDVAKAATETADIYMKESASVRVDDPIGIRFSTYVSEEYAESGRSFGTLIIPKTAYSGDITDINQNTPNVLDIPQVVWAESDVTGYKKYTAVLIGIPESFYSVEIYAMSYANNGGVYEFVDNPQSYSVAYIASAALNNGETSETLYTYTKAVAQGITLDVSQATLWDNETLTLNATTQPAGYKAVWTSSNTDVATVDKNGVVTGVSHGTATITATFGNYTASCAITVWPYNVGFENGIPTNFITSKTSATVYAQSDAQASDGSYSLKITGNSSGYGYIVLNKEYLDKVFENEDVAGLNFEVYSTASFGDFRYKGIDASGTVNKNIVYNGTGPVAGEWKTFTYPRVAYENMAKLSADIYQIYFNGGAGLELYVDNMRPVTASELSINFAEGGEIVDSKNYQVNGETLVTVSGGVNNLMVYEGESTDGDGKSLRHRFWRGSTGGDIVLPMETMRAVAGAYSYIAFDVKTAYDVSGAVYYTKSSGTGTYADITANEWTTLYCPVNIYNLQYMTSSYIFRLPACNTYNDFFVYIDNIRFVDEIPAEYTITYDANGGSVVNATTTLMVGDTYTLETPTAAYDFLTFEGWYLDGEKFSATGTWTLSEDITLTAKWSNYQSFESGVPSSLISGKAGTNYSQSSAQASNGSYSLLLDTTTSNGYGNVVFNEAYLDSVFADPNVIGLAMDVYSNMSFADFRYRGWKADGTEGNIVYDNVGAVANTWKTIIYPRSAYETRSGLSNKYLLYYSPNAQGLDLYIDNMRGVTEEVSNDYTITYDANGGSVANATTTVTIGKAYTLETPTAAYDFLTFEGWYLDGEKFSATGTWTLSEDITLTAKWSNYQSFESGVPSSLITAKPGATSYSQSNTQASDGNYSLKLTGNSNGYGYIVLNRAYLDEVFADERVTGLAFDVYSTTTFTDFRYRGLNASGSEANIMYDSVGLTAGEWKTIIYLRSAYEDLDSLTGTLYQIYFNGGAGMELYVDNMRPVTEMQYASFGEIYITNDGTTSFDVGAVAERVQIDYQSVAFEVSGNSIAIQNSALTAGDHIIVVSLPNGIELHATLTVYELTEATAEMTLAYGSQGYQTLNYANVTRVLSSGMDIPFEYNSGNSSILIADATIMELLPTENDAKTSGTVEIVVLTTDTHYLLTITVTVSGTATELAAIDYINDYVFSSSGYTSVEYSTSKNIENLSPEKLLEYKNSGLTVLMPCSDAGVGTGETTLSTQTKTLLENAALVGLKVVLYDNFLMELSESTTGSLIGTTYADTDALDEAVWARLQMYCGYEAFYGVALGDEPAYGKFTAYGEVYQSIKRVCAANNVECYIHCNMLAGFAGYEALGDSSAFANNSARFNGYKAYLQKFLDVTGADYVMYDLYPLTKSGLSGWMLFTLQAAAEVAKENNVDLNVVTQTCTIQSSFFETDNDRIMSTEDLHWINNMLLGFGVKEIHYFTYYARPDNDNETYVDEGFFLTAEGEKTDVYYRMQAILAQNQQFASVIKSFDYVSSNLIKGASVTYNNTGISNTTDSKRYNYFSHKHLRYN